MMECVILCISLAYLSYRSVWLGILVSCTRISDGIVLAVCAAGVGDENSSTIFTMYC